jgi:FkbM family methyltransferase
VHIPIKKVLRFILSHLPGRAYRQMQRDRKAYRHFSSADERRVDFYSQFINPGDLVFDVGANLGNRSKVFLKLGARVVGFEPQQKCIRFLKQVMRDEKRFTLLEYALGSAEGEAEMLVSDAHTISTLSSEWVGETTASGRFSEYRWKKRQAVQVVTLDRMIEELGVPAFIKIDVEGYEFEVLSGLSTAVKNVSIEFVPELIRNTHRCLDHLMGIESDLSFQVSLGESMIFDLDDWVDHHELVTVLERYSGDVFGDIYIRFNRATQRRVTA